MDGIVDGYVMGKNLFNRGMGLAAIGIIAGIALILFNQNLTVAAFVLGMGFSLALFLLEAKLNLTGGTTNRRKAANK